MQYIGALIAFFILVIDQITKFMAVKFLSQTKIFVCSLFSLDLVYNKGISFGLFNNFQYSNLAFSIISFLIVIYLLWWLHKTDKNYEKIGLGFIIGGAIGNIIDRFVYPGVVDFLSFHWKEYYFPSFNVADSSIFLGVCILIIFSIDWNFKTK